MAASLPTAPSWKVELSYDALIPYLLIHLGCLAAFWTGISWNAVGIFAVCFALRMLGLNLCYHRYFAHRSFKTSRAVQMVLAVIGCLTFQGGVLWWTQWHRYHHRHTDTPDDIHSPHHQGFLYSHAGWFVDKRHRRVDLEKVADFARYPELVWLEKWNWLPNLLYVTAIWVLFGGVGIVYGFFINCVLGWHVTHWVQSFSHTWAGYRRWDSPDHSRNHWFIGLITLGEFHNNHHQFPSSARQGHVWWEIDLGYYLMRGLERAGLVWDLKIPPELRAPDAATQPGTAA